MNVDWQPLSLASAILTIVAFALSIYSLRTPKPHRFAWGLFLGLGILLSLGTIGFYEFTRSSADVKLSVPLYSKFAEIPDVRVTALTFSQGG